MKYVIIGAVLLTVTGTALRVHAADETIAARVNGTPITVAQVEELANRMSTVEDAPAETIRQEALQSLIDSEVLSQQAQAEKIEATDAEVDQRLATIKDKYSTPEAFQEALTSHNASEADLRNDVRVTLLIQKVLAQHVSVKLADDAAEQYYKANPDKFHHPEQVHARHLLFVVAPNTDEKPAKKRADSALKRIRQGTDVGALAKELSDDTGTKYNQGDLGFVSRDDVPKAFADAAFALKPGAHSGVVRTEYGFHIIQVSERRPAGIVAFADAKTDIESSLEQDEREKQARTYVDGLKQHAKIEMIEPPTTGAAVTPPAQAAPAAALAVPSPPATPNQ